MSIIPPVSATLGAPGVRLVPVAAPPALGLEPLDVAAFVGVAPRGPAWVRSEDPTLVELGTVRARSVAVAVDSWEDYLERFGAFEGPGLLPHAVSAYFAQGGRRAYVVRIVADDARVEAGTRLPRRASHTFDLRDADGRRLRLYARDEGAWGDRLGVRLSFRARAVELRGSGPDELRLAPTARVVPGALLRLHGSAGEATLRWARSAVVRGRAASVHTDLVVELDASVPFAVARAEEVLAVLDVRDADPLRSRAERHEELGLHPAHPRWLVEVVGRESHLVEPAPHSALALLDASLAPVESSLRRRGADRWTKVTPGDVFGRLLEADERAVDGLDALLHAPEVASVVVPDLYSPAPVAAAEPVEQPGTFAGPDFAPCLDAPDVVHPAPPPTDLLGLRLDPTDAAQLETIIGLQQQLVLTAERLAVVALLDVPPRLRPRQVLRWRARFDSSWAAGYHPWLRSPTGSATGTLVDLPPSAAAAGIVARCERRAGVPKGPANERVAWAVDVAARLDEATVDELHVAGIDTLRMAPDGVVLVGARTLSNDRSFRQLTVRRLLQLLERAVARQLQWTVFEPNDDQLRVGLRRAVEHLLRELFDRGAFAGATSDSSWFVRVGSDVDRGQVLVELGVAPSEPLEHILLRVALDDGGGIEVVERAIAGVALHG